MNVDVLNSEEMSSSFSAEQLTEIDKQTQEILAKMNSTRTTADRPVLKKEDCIMIRYLSPTSKNYKNYLLCPNDPSNSKILEMGVKNSIYVKMRDSTALKEFPDALEGDKYNLQVIGDANGEATVKDDNMIWADNSQPVIKPTDIDKVKGKACAVWFIDMFVDTKFDGNCCFAFMSKKKQIVICETSSYCITKSRKVLKFLVLKCHSASAAAGKSGLKPKHVPKLPFYKNEKTKN